MTRLQDVAKKLNGLYDKWEATQNEEDAKAIKKEIRILEKEVVKIVSAEDFRFE